MTRMPKAIARRAISVPTRPIPRMPRVLLYNSTPSYRWRSHFPARTLASACGMARAMLTRSEKACSAVEIVFPPGVFITITPRLVAVVDIDVVDTYPCAPDHSELFGCLENCSSHLSLAANNQRREFGNHFDEVRLGHIGLHNDFELSARGDLIQPTLGDGISDQNLKDFHKACQSIQTSRRCQKVLPGTARPRKALA